MVDLKSKYRTHTCAELRDTDVGQKVKLSGWIRRMRDHGGLVFIDLCDNYGNTQIVFPDETRSDVQKLRLETVIGIEGEVLKRAPEMVNSKLNTGGVEVRVESVEVYSSADVLPFQIAEDDGAPEPIRLKHRFLELRREKLHENILLRSKVIRSIRDIMQRVGFFEFETPILTASSPEGARDYIVPSRLHPGKFFALPQAPQMFKQLIMVSGFDRYFQIAPCFRDEDARADRSPGEFYQLDMEMSFVEQDDVFEVFEEVFHEVFTTHSSKPMTPKPFPRLTYDESMSKYGTDKPDLRNSLIVENVSDAFKNTEFRVFKEVVEAGGQVLAIKVNVPEIPPRKYFDDSIEWFKKQSGQGLAYLSFEGDNHKGSIAKFFGESEIKALRSILKIEQTCSVFFAAGEPKKIRPHMARLRDRLGADFDCIDDSEWRLTWITDYPLYEDDENGGYEFGHNPFSMPQGGLEALETKNPLDVRGYQYDLVGNGYELLSGAIRNHSPDIMYKAFEIAGYGPETVDERFGGMIKAFKFGAPPHGGGAVGIERVVMLLAGEEAIREVIVFPLVQTGEDLLMNAPSEVSEQQLKDVHIKLDLPPEPEK